MTKTSLTIMRDYLKVQLAPLPYGNYKILKDIQIDNVFIPAGYVTDMATIPRILWPIQPPNDASVLVAIVIHDYLCDVAKLHYYLTEDKIETLHKYELADRYLERYLRKYKASTFKRRFLVTGPKFYTSCIRPFTLNKDKINYKQLSKRLKLKTIDDVNNYYQTLEDA